MGKPTKTIAEKLQTKLDKLAGDERLNITAKTVKIDNRVLFRYSKDKLKYSKLRYFPSKKEDVVEEEFSVTILLDHDTLRLVSSSPWNPPKGTWVIADQLTKAGVEISSVTVGGTENKIEGKNVLITKDLYDTFVSINREEGADKVIKVKNRIAPFLENEYNLEVEDYSVDRDHSLLLKELIASKSVSQEDIMVLSKELESGEKADYVIDHQITKQAEWLLDSMQEIVDHEDLTAPKAKDLGKNLFGFPKIKITGPEDLMEQILTKYGKNIIFGVPFLLNSDKYVISSTGVSRSQFDLILVNLLSDIEIVELKRPDELLFKYDAQRGKFYTSKELGMAVAQSERYVSAILRDNDSEFTIDGKTIRKFIESEVGGTISLSVCRPSAIVVIGSIHRLVKPYDQLSSTVKSKVTEDAYNKNAEQAYQELKGSYKNIQITTYSELIEAARLRLQNTEKET